MQVQKTILVADDDADDIFLLQRAFEKANIRIKMTCVRDGDEAVEFLQTATMEGRSFPELFFLDLKMPRMDGFEVLEWVRRQPGLKRLPILVLTSSDEPEDINRAYDLGANSYLVKPFGNEYLEDIVASLTSYWLKLNRRPDCSQAECGQFGL
jgi:CheY-like chemotaxis protein